MKVLRGKIDENDLEFIQKRFGTPLFALPAPITKYKTGKNKGLIKINPHVSRFFYHDRITDLFHVKPVYYETMDKKEWRPLYEIASYYGNKNGVVLYPDKWYQASFRWLVWMIKRQELLRGLGIRTGYVSYDLNEISWCSFVPLVLNPTDTFFPDPDPETTSVDGAVEELTSAAWATIRSAAGDSATPSAAQTYMGGFIQAAASGNEWNDFWRGIILFDTSSIPDANTIDSGTHSTFSPASGSTDANFNQDVSLVDSNPASNTNLVATDYPNSLTTTQATADVDLTNWNNANAYQSFTLNTTGLNNVSKTGVTKFGHRLSGDRTNTEPTWAANGQAAAYANTADSVGTSTDPKLVITHSAAVVVTSPTLLSMYVG